MMTRVTAALTCAVAWLATPANAQDTPELSPEDAEAYEMSQAMQYGCDPRRSAAVMGSESVIENDPEPLAGTAAFFSEDEGMFFVFERYGDDESRHCMVLALWGGAPAPGRYGVKRLSQSNIAAEASAERHAFFGMLGVRNEAAASILVVESGFVEIATSAADRITGTFELVGFAIDGAARTDGVMRRGSFTAVKLE